MSIGSEPILLKGLCQGPFNVQALFLRIVYLRDRWKRQRVSSHRRQVVSPVTGLEIGVSPWGQATYPGLGPARQAYGPQIRPAVWEYVPLSAKYLHCCRIRSLYVQSCVSCQKTCILREAN